MLLKDTQTLNKIFNFKISNDNQNMILPINTMLNPSFKQQRMIDSKNSKSEDIHNKQSSNEFSKNIYFFGDKEKKSKLN